jgi:hypothetical protein
MILICCKQLWGIFMTDKTKHIYYIMNKNVRVCSFTLEIDNYIVNFKDNEIYNEVMYRRIFAQKSLIDWLRNRRSPLTRAHIRTLFSKHNLDSDKAFIDYTLCLGLNDNLWVNPSENKRTWDEVNLYRNTFNEVIAELAFSGESAAEVYNPGISPEFGTSGALPKCWKRYNDGIYLLKGGTSNIDNKGYEAHNEYYCSQIAEVMQLPDYVKYDLVEHKGRIASKCKLFTDEDYGFVPVKDRDNLTDVLKYFKTNALYSEDFANMMIFDAVIMNPDRHLMNFGYKIDNNSLGIIKLATIFDNGLGLLPYWRPNQKSTVEEQAGQIKPYNGLSFKDVAQGFLGVNQRKMVERLKGFKFNKHPLYNWDEERFEPLEKLIENQVKIILEA